MREGRKGGGHSASNDRRTFPGVPFVVSSVQYSADRLTHMAFMSRGAIAFSRAFTSISVLAGWRGTHT